MTIVKDNKSNRFVLLFALYIAANADYDHALNTETLAESRGLSGKDFKKSYKYLCEEEFIVPKDGGSAYHARLTHKGIKALEEVFLDEYEPTYYFPAYRDMR